MTSRLHLLLCGAVCAVFATSAQAQVVFSDDFTSATNWTEINLAGDAAAVFGFDYNDAGDPNSPRIPANGGGDTLALKVTANVTAGAANAMSVVTNPTITGTLPAHYTVEFDSWFNYTGPLTFGGAGSTEFGGALVGNDGVTNGYAPGGGAQLTFAGDAGSSVDLRAYSGGGVQMGLGDAAFHPVLTGRNHNNIELQLGLFPSTTAPADQLVNFPAQTDATRGGAAGFAWRHWTVDVDTAAGVSRFTVDGKFVVDIAETDGNGYTAAGAVGISYADLFGSLAGNPDVSFGLFDNFVVTQVPEPTSLALVGFAATMLGFRRRNG